MNISHKIKDILDKLPFNGKKTIIGLVMFLVSVGAQTISDPDIVKILDALKDILQGYGAEDLFKVSIGTILVGAYHKRLKLKIDKCN